MIEKVLHSESGNVYYWISDIIKKETLSLFFMHGLTASHELFIRQIGYFEKDYNVIAWDAPAHGMPRPYYDFSYEKAANDAVKVITKKYYTEEI
ncbi:alpha/beta fold hydrolase [Butyrivibrio sp. AE3004]|uniref:alpha/beta fold hydrolase n=1 Tax=Butyrivibrio sp. AE3004 TaxID=1506994 RepID=UPI000493FF0F|nr:alpha/beta hydrolase [Butyrivibrio sp. AE3004]